MEGNSDILAEKLKKEMDLMPLAQNYDITYSFKCCFFSKKIVYFMTRFIVILAQIWTQPALVFPAMPDCPDSVSFRQILAEV